jgi:hypothetical protein
LTSTPSTEPVPQAGSALESARCLGLGAGSDLVVRAGLPRSPVGGDLAGGAEELGEVRVEEVLGGGLGGVDGDVHGGADPVPVPSRTGTAMAHAGGELFVGEGPAAGADLGQLGIELVAGVADVRREARA